MVAQLSPSLNVLVNGNTFEAQEGRVVWFDYSVDTFLRFASFVYTGDYNEPQPLRRQVNSNGERMYYIYGTSANEPRIADYSSAWDPSNDVHTDLPYSIASYLARASSKEQPSTPTQTAKYAAMMMFKNPSSPLDGNPRNSPRPKQRASEFLAQILEDHVRVYVLAEENDIDSLKTLSLDRLRQTLVDFIVSHASLHDLRCVVDDIYDFTVVGSPAREMIAKYFSFFVEHISNQYHFWYLLKRADFAQDLVEQMVQRLN